MTITLITGANKGLGYETARRLLQAGHTVYLAARDPERGQAAATRLGTRWVELDVTVDTSVDAAAKRIEDEEGHLDVLVNNAAIAGGRTPPGQVTGDELQAVLDTDLNANQGAQTVEEGAEIIVRMACVGADGPTATFHDAAGSLPW
jgi:NAD(P)-dependent dehydrogenase (short-subunit alcohol dehydrogenase family)